MGNTEEMHETALDTKFGGANSHFLRDVLAWWSLTSAFLVSSAALHAAVAREQAPPDSFLTSLNMASRDFILAFSCSMLPATLADALPPITFIKNRMKATEMDELYTSSHST